jgi:hypothetical protein
MAAFSGENVHLTELMVGDRNEADLSLWGHECLDVIAMDLAGLLASAVSGVDRVLQHHESTREKFLPELRVGFALLPCAHRQIEECE